MTAVFLYHSEGAHTLCVDGAENALKTIYGREISIIRVDSSQIERSVEREALGICFPGGNATVQGKALGDTATTIKRFVDKGGQYWGFCAGSYLASSGWNLRSDDFIVPHTAFSPNLLEIVPGSITGPINQEMVPGSFAGAESRTVKFFDNRQVEVIVNGCGPVPEPLLGGRVFARYVGGEVDRKPAIARYPYGEGSATLIGPHIELDVENIEDLNESWNWELVQQGEEVKTSLLRFLAY